MNLRRALFGAGIVAVAALASLVAACGSSSDGRRGEPDAAPVADAAVGDSGYRQDAGIGVVTFSQAPDGGGTFFAAFTESPLPPAVGCTFLDAGACTTGSCVPPPADAGAAVDASPAAPAPNPGPLRITGGAFGPGVSVGPDMSGAYLYVSPGTIFAPGDTLGVTAPGGSFPELPLHTVVAPQTVTLTEPPAPGGKMSITTSKPLVVSWTGGHAGSTMVITATAIFTSGGVASLTCQWDAASGTATVPSEALAPLAAENALTSGVIWYQAAVTRFDAGSASVTMSAYVTQLSVAAFQ